MKINQNEITKSANVILENVKNFEQEIKNLNNVIEKINVVWNGSDSLKFVNTMKTTYSKELKQLANDITDYGEYLKNVPKAYETLDEIFSKKNINI